MAAIVRRPRRGGMALQVRWREDGVWQSDTFDTERKALRFKCDVEAPATGGRRGGCPATDTWPRPNRSRRLRPIRR